MLCQYLFQQPVCNQEKSLEFVFNNKWDVFDWKNLHFDVQLQGNGTEML
jgi:hypothetical protein